MQLEIFRYAADSGWSVPDFPPLDSANTLVVVFGGSNFLEDSSAIAGLAAAYPQATFMGCSSAGEIFDTQICDDGLAVAVTKFDAGEIRYADAEVTNASKSQAAGADLAKQLRGEDLAAVFVLSDGLSVNGTELAKGLNSELPDGVVVTGGLAGDGDRFEKTWVLRERQPSKGIVAAIGLYGTNFVIRHGSKGGWDPFGPERTVTKSHDNVLEELDGQPALALYKKYLGDRAAGLPATGLLFPLSMRTSNDDEKRLVRTILAIDEDSQSMTFAGDVPEGCRVQLMKADFDRLIDGAADAAEFAKDQDSADAVLSIAISCVGRRLVLGERTEEEVEATLDVLPSGTRQVGFYSYGEISPYATGRCDLHNQTMTLTTIREN